MDIDDNIRPDSAEQATGIYRVNYSQDSEKWETQEGAKTSMNIKHQWMNAHYAAVSGVFDSKERAGEILIDHISNAYRAAIKKKDSHNKNKHYSLYWQKGKHQSSENASHLASLIQQAQSQNASVNWLVHGEGAGTFVLALEELKNKQLAQELMSDDATLSYQNVFFSNPRGNRTTQDQLKALCKKAGIGFVGVNINPTDFHNQDNLEKAKKEGYEFLAKTILFGTGSATGYANIEKGLGLMQSAGGLAASTLIGLGIYMVGKSTVTKYSGYARHLPAAYSSTFGKGNQAWAD